MELWSYFIFAYWDYFRMGIIVSSTSKFTAHSVRHCSSEQVLRLLAVMLKHLTV